MDQNTNQGQQSGGGTFDPFAAQQGAGAAQSGGNPAGQDPAAVTPPWLSFSADPAASAPVDPFATNPFDTSMQNPAAPAPINPWEQTADTSAAPAMSNPWDVAQPQQTMDTSSDAAAMPQNPWDLAPTPEVQNTPASNPWDTPVAQNEAPWAAPTETAPMEAPTWDVTPSVEEDTSTTEDTQEEEEEDTSSQSMTKKSSEDLLAELKRRFEEEEGEVQDEINVHEENIKMEQEAIRNLKASRRTQVANMKHMFEELKTILKIEDPKPEHRPEIKPQPKPHIPAPRPQHQAPKNPNFPPRDKPREPLHKPAPSGEAAT